MLILHFSDTHIGSLQRDIDFYNSFRFVINEALRLKVDYVIHTGDFFDKSRPSNEAITFAISELKRLSDAKIPIILIAGNHSIPKEEGKVSILEAFKELDYIYSVTNGYQKVEFENIIFHSIPHINSISKRLEAISNLPQNIDKSKKNILLLHCSIKGDYLMSEFGEWVYPKEHFDELKAFDYVALGHWHKMKKVDNNIYYSGSTERTSSSDRDSFKHFLLIELNKELIVTPHKIEIKEMFDMKIKNTDLESMEADEIEIYLKKKIEENKESIITLQIDNISEDLNQKLPYEMFKEYENILKVKKSFKTSENKVDVNFDSLEDMFLEHLKKENPDRFEALQLKALEIFREYGEKN